MSPACRAIVIVLCVFACPHPVAATFPDRSVSISRQFLVYGPSVRLRGVICDLAERTKQDILQLIGQRDGWSVPIVIHAQYPQANLPEIPRSALSLSQTGFGLKLQLDLTIGPEVEEPEIRRALLHALLLEMRYRQVPDVPAGTTCAPPPRWLLDGLLARGSGMTGSLATPVAADKTCSLKEFLRQRSDSPDAPDRSLLCAYSAALLELLAYLPEGRERLVRFISDIPSASDEGMAQLKRHFPELINPTGALQKMWLSHIARLATEQSYELLGGKETERRLNKLLRLKISAAGSEKHYQLHEFPTFLRALSSKPALVRLGQDLSGLMAHANPIYRATIFEYEKIAGLLSRGKTNGITGRLARLSASRQVLSARMEQIDDYLNWFEAVKSNGSSGLFAEYLKTADLSDRPEERRRDPLSVYLDVLETEFQN